MKKNKLIIGLLLFATLTSCGNKEKTKETNSKENTQIEETTKKASEDDYNFFVDENGKVVDKENTKDKKIIQWYTDPGCSACVRVESKTNKEKLNKLLKDNNAVIKYNFVGLQDSIYGNKISSYILAVLKYDKENAVAFMEEVMNEKYTKFNKAPDEEETIKKTYEKIGGKKWKKIEEEAPSYAGLVQDKSNEFLENKDMLKKSPNKDGLFTPFIYVEGTEKALSLTANEKGEINLLEVLKSNLEK